MRRLAAKGRTPRPPSAAAGLTAALARAMVPRMQRALASLLLGLTAAACNLSAMDTSAASAASSDPSETAADAPDHLRIATFNVRRLFDTTCQSGACGPGDFEQVPTQEAFDARVAVLAEAIADLGADVVVLQEVENAACLDALAARLPELPTAHLGELGFAASLDVALFSDLPTLAVVSHAGDRFPHPDGGETSFSRDLLQVHLDAGLRDVIVLAAHFRSKVNDDPGRRLAEATRAGEILALLAASRADALLVLAGDLNDVPTSPPLQAMAAATPLLRAAADLADDATYRFDGTHIAIDHIFQALDAAGAYVPGSARVFNGASEWGYGGSDHAALRATFDLDP